MVMDNVKIIAIFTLYDDFPVSKEERNVPAGTRT